MRTLAGYRHDLQVTRSYARTISHYGWIVARNLVPLLLIGAVGRLMWGLG